MRNYEHSNKRRKRSGDGDAARQRPGLVKKEKAESTHNRRG